MLKVKNLRKIQQKLISKKKNIIRNPIARSSICNMINSATLNFWASYSKLFSYPLFKLERLEDSLNFLPKSVNISLKELPLKPKIKISSKIANTCKKDCYIFIWNLHQNCKGMLIRSSLDNKLFHWVKVSMSLK